MLLGHGLFAFAAVAAVASRRVGGREALSVGVLAGLIALTPDVDVLFALPGLLHGVGRLLAAVGGSGTGDVFTVTGTFWAATTDVHRSVTHSLVVGLLVAVGVALVGPSGGGRRRVVAGVVALALPVAVAAVVTGAVAAVMVGATVAAAAGLGVRGARRLSLSGRALGTVTAAALLSHPFGDVFTGRPPRLFYPFGFEPLAGRVAVSSDPTLHLLFVFGLEVIAAWAAVGVAFRLADRSPLPYVRGPAVAGVGYGLAALVLTPPTLDTSFHFVFSVLGVGLACAWVAARDVGPAVTADADPDPGTAEGETAATRADGGPTGRTGRRVALDGERLTTGAVSGVVAVTLAWAAYLLAYGAGLAPT